ncbi:hypothetical protein TNCV_4927971 [Trichonephila clavipes]|nr:hypothetical protein TNCV_4927971 [Trichonephila clavipes]
MLPGRSTSLTPLFHGCGSHLKLLESVVDGTGEVVCEKYDRLQKTSIYRPYQQKRNRRTTAQQHRTARLQWCREHHNWTGTGLGTQYYSRMRVGLSLSSDCRRQLIWREGGTCLSSRKYPGKGPISDMQYRGVGRHHDPDDSATCHRTHTLFRNGLDSEGIRTSPMASARSPDLNPIENVWDALGGKLLVETILRQTRTPSSVHSQRNDKLPQQLLDNVVQSMVRRVECCIALHGGHIPY